MDTRTGRPPGDHGRGADAIEFVLHDPKRIFDADAYDKLVFLEEWQCGAAHEEYPEFYEWLKETGR